jgi:MOSC domain-containing protein YiiM
VNTESFGNHTGRSWESGYIKEPVPGDVWLGKYNLSGDGQADLKNHGGLDKAVLAYSDEHYRNWALELNRNDLRHGAFGENFTVAGITEGVVCIGDTYTVGDARIQVSQPRRPCWKISYRWQVEDLSERVELTGRTGWYFRELKEGFVRSGLPVVLDERPFPQWTVVRANEIMRNRREDRLSAGELASCPLISESWRSMLSSKG